MLTSLALIILAVILYLRFRSLRDMALILTTTSAAIVMTYGIASLAGITFNAAMNAIPILLLGIGVDYGIHVVSRYREELVEHAREHGLADGTARDIPAEARAQALARGAVLTSAALFVAITTDMVGFLSFRFSSQPFLRGFGTTIAIGLFLIYLLSITALPALVRLIPTKRQRLERASKVDESAFSRWVGRQAERPWRTLAVVVLLSIPMAWGMTTLEAGFDTRDQQRGRPRRRRPARPQRPLRGLPRDTVPRHRRPGGESGRPRGARCRPRPARRPRRRGTGRGRPVELTRGRPGP